MIRLLFKILSYLKEEVNYVFESLILLVRFVRNYGEADMWEKLLGLSAIKHFIVLFVACDLAFVLTREVGSYRWVAILVLTVLLRRALDFLLSYALTLDK